MISSSRRSSSPPGSNGKSLFFHFLTGSQRMNHSWIRLFGLRTSRILFLEDILPWTLGKESLLIMKMTRSFSTCDREQISQSSSITVTSFFWTQTSSPFQRSSKMCQAPWEVIIGILLWLSDLSWTIQATLVMKVSLTIVTFKLLQLSCDRS